MVAAAVMGAAAVSAAGARTTTTTKQDRQVVIRIPVRWPHCESCGAADVGEIRCSYCGSLWRIGYRE